MPLSCLHHETNLTCLGVPGPPPFWQYSGQKSSQSRTWALPPHWDSECRVRPVAPLNAAEGKRWCQSEMCLGVHPQPILQHLTPTPCSQLWLMTKRNSLSFLTFQNHCWGLTSQLSGKPYGLSRHVCWVSLNCCNSRGLLTKEQPASQFNTMSSLTVSSASVSFFSSSSTWACTSQMKDLTLVSLF